MSQYGAKAMADLGYAYDEIVSHYYTGLAPEDAGELVPEIVRVGLTWGQSELTIAASGPFLVKANGKPLGAVSGGQWEVRLTPGGVAMVPADPTVRTPLGPGPGSQWPR